MSTLNPTRDQLRNFAREANDRDMVRFVEMANDIRDAARHYYINGTNNGAWRELGEILMHSDVLYEELFEDVEEES